MPRRSTAVTTALAALAAVLLLAGCGSGSDGGSADSAAEAPAAAPTTGGPALAEDAADAPRAVVRTGTLELSAEDVTATAEAAVNAATAAGGYVAADDRSYGSGEQNASAELTLRVPAERFTETVDAVAALGTELSRHLTATDVGRESVDLDARIATKRASVERVRALMEDAASLSEVVDLEAELTARESALAELEARKRALDDRVSFSTLTVTIHRPAAPVDPEPAAAPPGFGSGLAAGWHAFLVFGAGLLTVLGALLPFAVAGGVPAGAIWTWSRRRRGLPVLRRAKREHTGAAGRGKGAPVRPGPFPPAQRPPVRDTPAATPPAPRPPVPPAPPTGDVDGPPPPR